MYHIKFFTSSYNFNLLIRCFYAILWFSLFVASVGSFGSNATSTPSTVKSRQSLDIIYLNKQKRVRNQRYSLLLKHSAEISDSWSSVVEGRARYDLALAPCRYCTQRDLPREVRDDELSEAEFREAYLAYQGELFKARIGLQKLTWIDNLFSQNALFLTPMDVRWGGYGDSSDLIMPAASIDVTHDFFAASQFEWVVAEPVVSRLPKGRNGYGFYEYLDDEFDGREIVVKEERVQRDLKNLEAGLRIRKDVAGTDASVFAYRGHRRLPQLLVEPVTKDAGSLVSFYYPRVTTYGFFSDTSLDDSTILRTFGVYEPDELSSLQVKTPSGKILSSDKVRRYRLGLGLDYMVSSDLKFYSEYFYTRIAKASSGTLKRMDSTQIDHSLNYRVTYDATQKTQLLVDGIMTGPERSYIVAPQIATKLFDEYRVNFGMRYVKSFSDKSQLDILRDTSHYYISLEHKSQFNFPEK